MKHRYFAASILLLIFTWSGAVAQHERQESTKEELADVELIRTTLNEYIEGSTNGQPDRLRRVFHPELNLYSIRNNELRVWSGLDYIRDTKEGKPTGETGKIISIDVENDAAIAKAEITNPVSGHTYVDYFMLLKTHGRWTIVHKMFTTKIEAQRESAPEASEQESREKEIDLLFREYNSLTHPGVAVAVIKDDSVVFKKAYGCANLEHQVPIDPDRSVFNVGSVSKQVTAFAALLLAEQQRLDLDESIHTYVPELNEFGDKITLRHLLYHTSGIRSDLQLLAMAGWSPGDVIDREDVMQMIFRQTELNFAPGEECIYSNSGYDLLAEIVTRVSGQSFDAFCQHSIFQPLGMNDSFFASSEQFLIPNLASPYRTSPAGSSKLNTNDRYSGSTGLHTTLNDLSKWTLNFRERTVGSESIFNQMDTLGQLNNGQTFGFAMGQFIEDYKGLTHIQHGGATSGYRAYIGRFPEQDLSIVLVSNCSSTDPREASLKVADLFLKDQIQMDTRSGSKEHELSVEAMQMLTGNYWNGTDQTVEIRIRDERLVFAIGGGPTIELQPVSDMKFEMLGIGVSQQVVFRKSNSGQYTMHVYSIDEEVDTYHAYEAKQYDHRELAEYVGTYYSPELDTCYNIDIEDGAIVVRHQRFVRNVLRPVLTDIFSNSAWRFTTLTFKRNQNQSIAGFRISSMRCRNVRFVRLTDPLQPSLRLSLAYEMYQEIQERDFEAGLRKFEQLGQSAEYYRAEPEFNNVGYHLLSQNRLSDAVQIFELNARMFPSSWNAYDSLGEAYRHMGETTQAIETYEKSIELNPDNENGVEALRQLRKNQLQR